MTLRLPMHTQTHTHTHRCPKRDAVPNKTPDWLSNWQIDADWAACLNLVDLNMTNDLQPSDLWPNDLWPNDSGRMTYLRMIYLLQDARARRLFPRARYCERALLLAPEVPPRKQCQTFLGWPGCIDAAGRRKRERVGERERVTERDRERVTQIERESRGREKKRESSGREKKRRQSCGKNIPPPPKSLCSDDLKLLEAGNASIPAFHSIHSIRSIRSTPAFYSIILPAFSHYTQVCTHDISDRR